MRENEHKEEKLQENCSTKWRDRHRNSVIAIKEAFPVGNIAVASVFAGCCITLLTNIENPTPDILTEVTAYSGATFLSSLAVSYIACMCKSPQLQQESKGR